MDLRLAVRSLVKAPGFALAAIVTLGLALTLCTTVLVVIKAYLYTQLPYPNATRLYSVRYSAPGQEEPKEMEQLDWSSLDDVIEQPIAWDLDMFYVLGGKNAESVPGAWVTPGFVQGLGTQPALGRGFDAAAFAPGSTNVALISHRLWQSRFGGDPSVIGRQFTAYVSDRPEEAEAFTIIGVLPATFWHVNPYTDIFAPLRARTYPYMVKLREGVPPAQAAARIAALVRGGAKGVPPEWTAVVSSTHELYTARVRPILRSVAAAAALVLLVPVVCCKASCSVSVLGILWHWPRLSPHWARPGCLRSVGRHDVRPPPIRRSRCEWNSSHGDSPLLSRRGAVAP